MIASRRSLTRREQQILELLADPTATIHLIALQLDLSEQYVRNVTMQIYRTLGVHSRQAAVSAYSGDPVAHEERRAAIGTPELSPAMVALFWSRVRRTTTCWIYEGPTTRFGYGTFVVARRWLAAHRVAYELITGPIPAGAVLMHSCDNPPCVNPKHLSPGSHSDNSQDMKAKGRGGWQRRGRSRRRQRTGTDTR